MGLLLDYQPLDDDQNEIRYGEMAAHINAGHLAWLTKTVRRRREESDLLLLGGLDG